MTDLSTGGGTVVAAVHERASAAQLGLVNRISDDPASEAMNLAEQIAAMAPLRIQLNKELLNASIGSSGLREHLELELRSQVIGLMTPDHRAAADAFTHRSS
jgi:enoyl-CoA hydratase